MSEQILSLKNVHVRVNRGTNNKKEILRGINLDLDKGDFVTIIGTNGAGKSTLFNTIAGSLPVSAGQILFKNQDITFEKEISRTRFLARVFQDPKLGTAPRMTVAENMLLAQSRGKHRLLRPRRLKQQLPTFTKLAQTMNNGLEKHMLDFVETLSGGQRQALNFLMATMTKPDLLLLDEHTAALDPRTSQNLLAQTQKTISENHLTALMITHRLTDALKYGNRLLILKDGQVAGDFKEKEKQQLTAADLYQFFN